MHLLKVIIYQLNTLLLENLLSDEDLDPDTITEEQKATFNEIDKAIIFNTHKTYTETKAKILNDIGKQVIQEVLDERRKNA
jgi:hypothetical protein